MLSFHVGGKVVDRVDLLRKKHWVWRLDVWPFAILYSGWLIAIVPSIDFGDAAIVLGGLVAFHILVWLFTAWSVDFKCFAHYSKINDIHLADACKITPVKFCGSKEVVPLQFWKQVFCVGLWCLDEYWYYSLFTLFMLFMFESTMAKSRLKTLTEIRRVRVDNQTIMVHRCGKWVKLAGTDLVPGDVVSIGRSSGQTGEDKSVPADMLILGGSAIVNEAILTGESTPQWKVSIMGRETGEKLSARRDKSHVLFGGTKILQHTPDKTFPLKTPDGGCLAVVLRTGFETSQGKLMRTILFSTERVTANSWESGLFILFLVVFAVIAAGYVLKKGMEDPTRSKYKLFLSCSLIITSVIPPELPMELSIAVNTSLIALARRGIFCTEPFRIPFAGKVDMCCFDKTGTLTSDDMEFRGVVGLSNAELEDDMTKVPVRTQEILASCHALVFVDNKLVGDPLEKAALKGIDWSYKSDEKAMPKRGGGNAVQIVQRHHFASHLKRMSVVVRVQEEFFAFVKRIHELIVRGDMQVVHQTPAFNVVSNTRLLLTGCGRSTLLIGRFVFELFSDIRALFMAHKRYLSSSFAVMQEKGAPETIQDRLTDLPSSYIETYKKYTHQGSRVLALAFKSLPDMTVFNCPIREDSAKILSELKNSSQDLAMITGDQALTACYVASQVHIVTKPVLILCPVKNGKVYEWVSPDETEKIQYSEKEVEGLTDAHDLCIGGDCFEMLQQTSAVLRVIPYVKVFARVAPEQKELILTTFKAVGRMTLMCGDGTNDVGALKQAHVGVALLNAVPPTQSGNSSSEASKDENTKSVKSKKSKSASEAASKAMSLNSEGTSKGKASARLEANSRTAGNRHLTAAEMQREKLKKMMEELNEEGDGRSAPIVKLGDASMASPFTAKHASVAPTTDIIRQGRSTLVTTLQMFKILGLNCLATAYVLSVMYLDGVKLGDVQATISGVFTAAFFLFISHARPLPTLSAARPHPNIFCSYVFLSLMGQFAIHLFFLISSVKEAEKYMPDECIEPDADFHPNLVNTVSYMVNMMIQVATFAVNYMGHPFNQSISENKPFMYALMGAVGFFTVITSDLLRSLNDWLKLVPLPSGLRDKLLIWAGLMFLGCYSWERFLRWAFPGKVPAWRKRQRLAAANLEKKHV
ncbi:putative manganese-transporting ATPase PDR2 [Citrus sinensis]|uniref:Manganese-transporting ATPase PDR2 n=1 Tax=Citrus sinensis TaxID=2711 RepID=A0ACB8M803_CITSI|nr:putative manganese-transporting ATPase PDR2 [Citrus sinensis]